MVSAWSKIVGVLRGLIARASTADTVSSTDTEFTAEIVRIAEILPHPNADRLELAAIELRGSGRSSYQVVVQKGTYSVGDLAAYFSVDCVVPTAHRDFAFLKQRLDGSGKEYFRLRAARLRGVFSQGLLVPAPEGSEGRFGAPIAELFGVTYYRAPEAGEPTGANPGSNNSKRKRQPWTIYGVDSLKKLPRLFEPGEEVVVTEKIHGCNMRFGWVRRKFLGIPFGWVFRVGSHRAMKGDLATGAGYYGDDVWAEYAARNQLAAKTRDYKGYLFVGELYGHTYSGKAIQDLTYGLKTTDGPRLKIFDVKGPEGCWIPSAPRSFVVADCGLEEVPELYRGPYEPALLGMAEGTTTLWHPGSLRLDSSAPQRHVREGIVIESADRTKKAKFVGDGYLLRKEA